VLQGQPLHRSREKEGEPSSPAHGAERRRPGCTRGSAGSRADTGLGRHKRRLHRCNVFLYYKLPCNKIRPLPNQTGPEPAPSKAPWDALLYPPLGECQAFSGVSAFLFGVFFQLVLDVLDKLLHKGGIKLEERGNLPVLNSKTHRQCCDASPDAVSKYRLLIYYPASCWIRCERSRGAAPTLPLTCGRRLPAHTRCRSSHWLKQGAKHKIAHEPSPRASPEKGGCFAGEMLWDRIPHSASRRGLEMRWHEQSSLAGKGSPRSQGGGGTQWDSKGAPAKTAAPTPAHSPVRALPGDARLVRAAHKAPARAEQSSRDLSRSSWVGRRSRGPVQEAGGAGSQATPAAIQPQAACLLPPPLQLGKCTKKADERRTSAEPCAAGKPGWAEALLAARSSHLLRSWRRVPLRPGQAGWELQASCLLPPALPAGRFTPGRWLPGWPGHPAASMARHGSVHDRGAGRRDWITRWQQPREPWRPLRLCRRSRGDRAGTAHPPHARPSLAWGGCNTGTLSIARAGAGATHPPAGSCAGQPQKQPEPPAHRGCSQLRLLSPHGDRPDKARGSCRAAEKATLRLRGPWPPRSVPAAMGAAERLLLPVAGGDTQQHGREGAGAPQAHGSSVPTNIPQPNPGYNGMLPVWKFPFSPHMGTRDSGHVLTLSPQISPCSKQPSRFQSMGKPEAVRPSPHPHAQGELASPTLCSSARPYRWQPLFFWGNVWAHKAGAHQRPSRALGGCSRFSCRSLLGDHRMHKELQQPQDPPNAISGWPPPPYADVC